MMFDNTEKYQKIIKPKKSFFSVDFAEIWLYKELLYFLSLREIKVRYKQTILGAFWALLQPFITMIIFTLIFSNIANLPSEGIPYPIFSYSGLLLWIYFQNALSQSGISLISNSNFLTKVYFPRLFIPSSPCLAGLADYAISFSILGILMVYFNFTPGITIILLPIVLVATLILVSGMGFWLSSICVKYRDVKFILPFFIQLLMFISPVIYPSDIVGEEYAWILSLNPLTGLINAHRACLLGHVPINFEELGFSIVVSLIIFLTGMLYLKNTEKYFADLI